MPAQYRSVMKLFQERLKTKNGGGYMDILVILAAIGFGGWWLYKSGKRDGSRKGFGAGRRARGRRHSRHRRRR